MINVDYSKYEPIFGSWHITETISEDAYGRVYVIEKEQNGRTQKAILRAFTVDGSETEVQAALADGMSEDEIREYYRKTAEKVLNEFNIFTGKKQNRNIVEYEENDIIPHEDGYGFDVLAKMRYINPLTSLFEEKSPSQDAAVRLGTDMCNAISAFEKEGMNHGGINPKNVYRSALGDYRVSDVGLSSILKKAAYESSMDEDAIYAAPEVIKGGETGISSDMYSIGMMMYGLLNDGVLPSLESEEETPGPKYASDELKKVILKAISSNTEDRYQTVEEFKSAIIEGGKTAAPAMPEAEEPKKEAAAIPVFETAEKPEKEIEMDEKQEAVLIPSSRFVPKDRPKEELTAASTTPSRFVSKDHPKSAVRTETKEPPKQKSGEVKNEPAKKEKKKKKHILPVILILLLLIAGAAAAYFLIPKEITDITGIDDNISIYTGDTYETELGIEPGRFSDEKITFETEDEDIISIDKDGNITGLKEGEAQLILHAGEYTETVAVTVKNKVSEIKCDDIRVEQGKSKKIDIELLPEEFKDEKVTLKIKDESIAEIKDGKIKGISEGSTKLIISAGGCKKTVDIEVYVEEVVVEEPEPVPEVEQEPAPQQKKTAKSNDKPKKKSSSEGYFDDSDDEEF